MEKSEFSAFHIITGGEVPSSGMNVPEEAGYVF